MSARDFMPWRKLDGGELPKSWAPLNASESFREGEFVFVNTDGELAEAATATQVVVSGQKMCGIAAMDGDTTRTDGYAKTTGARTVYYPADAGILFITPNYTDGSGTQLAKGGTLRGEILSLEHNGGVWAATNVAFTLGTHVGFKVHDVLDADKFSVAAGDSLTAGAGYLVGEIITA